MYVSLYTACGRMYVCQNMHTQFTQNVPSKKIQPQGLLYRTINMKHQIRVKETMQA
jgi:hypothetical protein